MRRKLNKKRKEAKEKVVQPDEIKEIKVYPKQKCAVDGCTNNAVGSVDICKKHGGDPIVKDNLLEPCQVPPAIANASKYNPAYHPMAFIEMSRDGMSEVEVAAKFSVAVSTLRGWAETFAEFHTAFEIGQAMHEAWWLEQGKDNLDNRSYNVGLFKFLTGNKLGYSDKMESKNLNVHAGVLMVPEQMSESDWSKKVGTVKG